METIALLLVTENKDKASVIREALAAMDIHRIRNAYGYNEALELLKRKSASLIIVEMNIPNSNMSVVEFVSMIRKDIANFAHIQDVPVILLAGGASRSDVETARDAGITEFVVYPFSTGYLRTVIKSVVMHPRKFIVSENFFGPDRRRKHDMPPEGIDRRRRDDDE